MQGPNFSCCHESSLLAKRSKIDEKKKKKTPRIRSDGFIFSYLEVTLVRCFRRHRSHGGEILEDEEDGLEDDSEFLGYESVLLLRGEPYVVLDLLHLELELLEALRDVRVMLAESRQPQLVPQQGYSPEFSD